MRDIPVTDIAHPLADQLHQGYVVTESRAPVIFLNASRANLLASSAAAGVRVVLVTDELSSLTPAFAEVWRTAGAAWVVRGASGRLREGFTGRALREIGEVFTVSPVRTVDDVDLDFLRPTPADAVELMVTVSLRHRARTTTQLGGPLAGLAPFVGAAHPELWGAYEPAGSPWNRDRLTAFARERMPGEILMVAGAPRLVGTILARRTTAGVEEVTEARLDLGTPTTLEFSDLLGRLEGYLAGLAATEMPLIGIALARPGRRDLLVPPLLQHPPSPLALLIGPPGVRSFEIDVAAMTEKFDARVVGRPRTPGLLFSLGSIGPQSWQRLDSVLAALDQTRLDQVLGAAHRTVERSRARTADAE